MPLVDQGRPARRPASSPRHGRASAMGTPVVPSSRPARPANRCGSQGRDTGRWAYREHHDDARETAREGSAVSADVPSPKGALDAIIRSLAIEYADRGIGVNAAGPGVTKTPMHPPETHAFLAKLHPMGRMGEVQEIVEAVLYLESAAFVTGETLHVDGGAHAGHW